MNRLFLLALLLACGATQAAEWVSLGKANDGNTEDFIDVSSIRIAGGTRRAWVKTIMAAHYQKGTRENSNKWWGHFLSRDAFNCDEETSRREALIVYFTDGTNSSQPAADYPTQWRPVAPDTAESAVMHYICAWKPK